MSPKRTRKANELPYIPLGPFQWRIPGIHYKLEYVEFFQGLILGATALSSIPYLTDNLGLPYELAWSCVIIEVFMYMLHGWLGDPVVPGWITPTLPFTLAYLNGFPKGPERIQAMIALQLLVAFVFIFMGITKLADKFVNGVPNSIKGGILIAAPITVLQGQLSDGSQLMTAPIATLSGTLLLAFLSFSPFCEKNREKYLSSCRWMIDKRNETTKEHPFQLVKQIDILVFFPFAGMHVLSKTFSVENDVKLSDLLDDLKSFFVSVNPNEIFFSSEFSFYDKTSKEDVYEKIIDGIHSMSCFLKAMYKEVGEHSKLSDMIIEKISKLKFSQIPRDMYLINDYVYYPQKNKFKRAERYAMIMHSGDKRDRVRIPLSNFNRHPLYSKMGDDYFNKFVLMNVVIGTTNLMPTFMIVFSDSTFELDSFNGGLKTTIYRKVNEVATRIAKEDIVAVYFMMTYTMLPLKEEYLQMTSKERLALSNDDVLTFMEVTITLSERECYFEQTKIQDRKYIFNQIFNHASSLNIGKMNMRPIVEAFKAKSIE